MYPALYNVYTVEGPIPCCEKHAQQLKGLYYNMGMASPAIALLTEEAECTNCMNENKKQKTKLATK